MFNCLLLNLIDDFDFFTASAVVVVGSRKRKENFLFVLIYFKIELESFVVVYFGFEVVDVFLADDDDDADDGEKSISLKMIHLSFVVAT